SVGTILAIRTPFVIVAIDREAPPARCAITIEKARLELNENPDVLHQNIQQVRDMIITRPDIGFLRTDDAFILRFLRARKFHQTDAFRLLAQYFQYRQLNLDMFKNFKADDPGIKRALIDGFPGVLENPQNCQASCLRYEH
uniref:CRAL/TRIO N-terminal domain-containing protein n=1 Tax=Varanus komodoensis TaxID=61221 RepID=A0A8D2IZK0_VARKO